MISMVSVIGPYLCPVFSMWFEYPELVLLLLLLAINKNKKIKNNNSNSGYSNHIQNTGHKYGPITDTMDIINTHKEGKHMNTLEKYHIHKLYKNNFHMNDSAIEPNNPIFKTLHEIDNR
jgi:hypothetical protein